MISQNFQGIFSLLSFWDSCQELDEKIGKLLEELEFQKLLLCRVDI